MTEEQKIPEQKQLPTRFVSKSDLPIFFVNAAKVQTGLEEFYLTLGTASPIEVQDVKELERIDTIDAQPLFRCVVTKTTMRRIIDLLEAMYDQHTQQTQMFNQVFEREDER